ncbi:hypothetical protein MML48_6g00020129 [Holotrichia oblita]|uniref:Uncharacterized protein n=1 Tax=Holotrichia oblita TaxID=644536 RepID=A0ACB9SXG7_HOLOL|nr:hypothetical protein MML48_6g00020129 [Holotrichia oblita]
MIIPTVPPSATEHSVMPRICGKQKLIVENRIFGGKEASVGEFPWLARLVHFDEYNRTNLGCSGFLIHRKFILTAAHCLVGNVIRYLGPVQSVTLGIHNDTMSRICTAEFCIDPSRNVLVLPAIVHPNYDSYTKHNDIAVIPLKEKVQFTDYIKAICLSRTTTNASHFTVSGWGRTESGFNSKVKLKVDIPKANRTLCEQQYRTLGILISDKQVCAGGERGNDACTGDSGGPLMAMNDLGTAWYAEGIVSIGPSNCGTEGWPGVYTYIPKYYDWIIEQIKNNIKTYNVALDFSDCRTPNNINGICIEIENCKRLFDEVVRDNKDAFPFIRASRCGPYTATIPNVCCGPDISFTNRSGSHDLIEATTEHTILPRTCGTQKIFLDDKIYGGKQASIGEFPWLARLVYLSRDNRTNLGCSGFLIHNKFVLTAAHCVVGEYTKHLGPVQGVILGVYNDTTSRICVEQFCTNPPRNVSALPAIIHPNYESNTHNHDIALIPLKEKVAFTSFSSTTKLKVVVPRVNRAFCEQRYRTVGQSLTDRQLCAGGEQGYSACTGDSGGPLMAMTNDDTWYAEGIVSFGATRCGTENWPSVYTSIPKYYDWVLEQINNTLKMYNVDNYY